MFAACDQCAKKYDVTGKRAGARFKCPACKVGTIEVPSAVAAEPELETLEELEEEAPAETAGAPRASAIAPTHDAAASAPTRPPAERAGRRKPGAARVAPRAAKRSGPNSLLLAVGGLVVIGGALAFVLSDGGGNDSNTESNSRASNGAVRADDSSAAGSAATSGSTANSGAPRTSGDPRADYVARVAALGKSDSAGRAELAAFCDSNGLKSEARQLRRESLMLDPANEAARVGLGFTRYDGAVPHLRGRWLDAKDLALAVASEKYFEEGALAASATAHDVFVRNCEDAKRKWLPELPESDWFFAYGKDLMPQPFCVAIERPKEAELLEAHRQEYAEILSALHDVFFERYEKRFKLERDIERVIRVMMFDSVQSYRKHVANYPDQYKPPDGIGGYYSPDQKLLVMWRGGMDIRQVLFHEGTHLFVHYAFSGKGFQPSRQSPWVQEGIAELFAGHKIVEETVAGVKKKRYVLNQFIPGRYGEYRMFTEGPMNMSVLDLVKLDVYTFQEAQKKATSGGEEGLRASLEFGRVYAFGWVLCMYLNHAENGSLRNVLDDYLEAETKGEGYWQKLGELLGLKSEEAWDEFDQKVRRWAIDELPKFK